MHGVTRGPAVYIYRYNPPKGVVRGPGVGVKGQNPAPLCMQGPVSLCACLPASDESKRFIPLQCASGKSNGTRLTCHGAKSSYPVILRWASITDATDVGGF